MHDLARSEGGSIETANLFIGGCSLELHYRNMQGDKKAYSLEINGHSSTGFTASIKEALLAKSWDYVTIQQASHFSYQEDSYQPYITELVKYIRTMCPKAKVLLHQTWGYEIGSQRCLDHGFQTYVLILAMTWYGYLTGDSLDTIRFTDLDESVTDEEYEIAKAAVKIVLMK